MFGTKPARLASASVFGLALGLVGDFALANVPLSVAGYGLVYAAAGLPAAITALRALVRERTLDIDLLMVVAAIAAAAVGELRDGAILLVLFSVAGALQAYAMGRATRAIEALMALRPTIAHKVSPDGSVGDVPVAELAPGDRVVVRPGERVPVDGAVERGETHIDEATVTGEPIPVAKGPGSPVFEATVNLHGVLHVAVTKSAADSTVARMIVLVMEAQAAKAPSERFSAWFGRRYTIGVLVGSVAAYLVLLAIGFGANDALYRAATLLVAASPCAVVISVPAAILSALSAAARGGVLFKGGAALETLGRVDTFAFDKTGTLTLGRPEMAALHARGGPRDDAFALLAGLEAQSEHPIADAIRRAAAAQGVAPSSVHDVRNVTGEGIVGRLEDGRTVWAGTSRLAARNGADVAREGAMPQPDVGASRILVGIGARIIAAADVADRVRPTARDALAALRAVGVRRIAMLTGDHPDVAAEVAARLGIAPALARGGLLPADKVTAVAELRGDRPIAFVGDGVNDAGALARADVGIAMGAAGSDVALQAADVALLSDDLGRLAMATKLARRTDAIIKQNLAFAIGAMLVLVVATLAFALPLPLAVVGHEGGTLLVVANGLRLLADPIGRRRGRPKAAPETAQAMPVPPGGASHPA